MLQDTDTAPSLTSYTTDVCGTCTLNSIFPKLALASAFVRTNSPNALDVSAPILKSLSMPSIFEVNWAPHLHIEESWSWIWMTRQGSRASSSDEYFVTIYRCRLSWRTRRRWSMLESPSGRGGVRMWWTEVDSPEFELSDHQSLHFVTCWPLCE